MVTGNAGYIPPTRNAGYIPPPALSAVNLDLSHFTSDQVQSLLQQLSTHISACAPEHTVPSPSLSRSSITANGVMAAQSSVFGNFPFPLLVFDLRTRCLLFNTNVSLLFLPLFLLVIG